MLKLTKEKAVELHRQMWTDMQRELGNCPTEYQRVKYKEKWCKEHNIKVKHIAPSSPNLNGRIERPHGVDKWRYKKITTGSHTFEELREFCEEDCLDYNTYRPHTMLSNMTPVEFLQSLEGYKNACPDFSVLY